MKKLLAFVALLIIALVAANAKFHLYERWFKPHEFYFVTVRGTDFYLHGEPFRFIGANTRLIHGDKERGMLAEALQQVRDSEIRVIRQWAVGECENDSTANHLPVEKYYFQAGPNNWQEEAFVYFDSLVAEAARQELKVMITLANNWSDYGGMPMYVQWTGITGDSLIAASHDTFYTELQIEAWFKAFIDKLVLRRNTVTGVLYRDDPAIFSWELANEARARLDKYPQMVEWTRKMASYIKELDPHHLVGISLVLVDNRLERNHIMDVFHLEEIDYVDLHMYPAEHWWEHFLIDERSLRQLVDDYLQIAHHVVRKPLVIGEVGFARGKVWLEKSRDQLFDTLFDYSYQNGVSGVMVWSYSDPAWDDVYEINWRREEHAAVCSLLTYYGRIFFANEEKPIANPNIGPQFGSSLRVELVEQAFAPDSLLPTLATAQELRYEIPVRGYARAKWSNFNYWDRDPGFAKVYGKDEGYFEYPFFVPEAVSVAEVVLRARLSTAFPPVPGADTLGASEVTVSLNQQELATIVVRPQQYVGSLYEIRAGRDHGRPVLALPAGENILRFEVRPQAAQRNGLEIMESATTARYKSDEMPIILTLTTKLHQKQTR